MRHSPRRQPKRYRKPKPPSLHQTQAGSNSVYTVVGDLNDPPGSPSLAGMITTLRLVDGLVGATEDRPAPVDTPPAPVQPWTHRFKPARKPAQYELFDHVWLSTSAAKNKVMAGINRRTKLGGDGSDHDPAWVELEL